MADCVFCTDTDVRDREVYRDERVFAFPTNIPIVPGHLLVCPVRHVARLEELSAEELNALTGAVVKLKTALAKAFGAEGFNYAWNEGAVAGQSVPHLHLHLLPRVTGDEGITEYEPRKFLYRPGSREESPREELIAVARLVRASL